MKFVYVNDTQRVVNIHPATFLHGCEGSYDEIQPGETRTLKLPEGTYPWVKMWDHHEYGLTILISPTIEEE